MPVVRCPADAPARRMTAAGTGSVWSFDPGFRFWSNPDLCRWN
jgi:hypothetical protein